MNKIKELSDIALLFTTGAGQSNAKRHGLDIHFCLTTDNAKKWCSSDLSQGYLHGNHWAYFYNTLATFVKECGNTLDLSKAKDNGSCDRKLELLGIEKISLDSLPELLKPFGITVKL